MDFERKSLLNRSFSAPDISSNDCVYRKIYMEEYIYQSNEYRPIIRRFSCEQLLDQSILNKNKYFNAMDTSNINGCETSYNKLEYTPMEVDFTQDEIEKSIKKEKIDVSEDMDKTSDKFKSNIQPGYESDVLKNCKLSFRGHLPVLVRDDIENKNLVEANINKKTSLAKKLFMMFLFTAAFSILISVYDTHIYNKSINITLINDNLGEKVVNQNDQIIRITNVLQRLNNRDVLLNVLVFIGTTGVGKTYCTNFIKTGFKPMQIFDINIKQKETQDFKLYRNVPYLVVIDNLRHTDIEEVFRILEKLPQNKSILVVTIFNIQDTTDMTDFIINENQISTISENFQKSPYFVELLKFNSFNLNTVLENLDKLLKGYKFIFEDIKILLDDHDFDKFGFKGFFPKLDLILKKDL